MLNVLMLVLLFTLLLFLNTSLLSNCKEQPSLKLNLADALALEKAETETDEVYAQITLVPDIDQTEVTEPDPPVQDPPRYNVHSFSKALTASDTSIHGGFSVLLRHTDDCLPLWLLVAVQVICSLCVQVWVPRFLKFLQ